MKNDMKEIAERIRRLLDERGECRPTWPTCWTSTARRFRVCSRAKRGLAAGELAALCAHYGVSSDHMLFGADDHGPSGPYCAQTKVPMNAGRRLVEASSAANRYVRALVNRGLPSPQRRAQGARSPPRGRLGGRGPMDILEVAEERFDAPVLAEHFIDDRIAGVPLRVRRR